MNAPFIWIVLPLIISLVLWVLRRYRFLVASLATGLSLVLALAAWLFPIGGLVRLGALTGQIDPRLIFFGRQFILLDGDRFLLVLLYTIGAFWFFGEGVIRKNSLFVPVGFGIIALSIAALAVEPFLYAALIIEIIVLLSIPILVPPGTSIGRGVLRYLIFHTMAMAAILMAGWAAGGVEIDPTDNALLAQAVIYFGLGFAFWLAIFPFYTWMPLMVAEVQSYQAGFLLNYLPQVVLLLVLDFLNAFSWLRNIPILGNVFRISGILMVITGGIWAAFQKNLPRLMAYAVITEIGFSLLSLSLKTSIGYQIYVSLFLPRIIALALWSLAMSSLGSQSLDFSNLKGLMWKKPIESVAILVASFSLSGLPILATFPIRQVLMENLAQNSFPAAIWAMVGNAGLLIGSIRILITFIASNREGWRIEEDWRPAVLLVIGILLLLLVGIMPQWFLPFLKDLLHAFDMLG